jgi:hypothetical protein
MHPQKESCELRRTIPGTPTKYVGMRTAFGTSVIVRTDRGSGNLQPRLDLVRHCPRGFDWAHTGSGPAQLALALLAHASGSDRFALKHYQVFKQEIVARLPQAKWELTRDQVLQSLRFVCEEARVSDRPRKPLNSKPRKVATIWALLPARSSVAEISAHGSGSNIRAAATRALLNLLRDKRLRRGNIVELQIELSVYSAATGRNDDQAPDWQLDSVYEP